MEDHLLMIIPTPLNYVLGFLLGMDAAGGGGIAIVGAVANIQARTGKPLTLILFLEYLIETVTFTSIFLFVFALPIYWYRNAKKSAKQANSH